MKAQIFSKEICLGTADLKISDNSMGVLSGNFFATDAYYKHVQKSVWQFWSSKKPDYSKWESLQLSVKLENGCFLYAAGGFTVNDLSEFPEEPLTIDIAGVDRYVIDDFFNQQPPLLFVEEPWESISVEQKLAFENELKKELGDEQTDHILTNSEFMALSTAGWNDDVLFRIVNKKLEAQFAVVHLTWSSNIEKSNYPKTTLYNDFEGFKLKKMYPDKTEYEL